MSYSNSQTIKWLTSKEGAPVLLFSLAILVLGYFTNLLEKWLFDEHYGHGLMAFGVLVYMVYQRWDEQYLSQPGNKAVTYVLAVFAFILSVISMAADITLIGFYGIWFFVLSALYAVGGLKLLRFLLVPLLIFILLIPFPTPVRIMLTSELQLISSHFGVWLIRLFGGSVYLEGNVLDMGGSVQLMVAEACSGLRYLLPLMSIGAFVGYALNTALWIRIVIFLSAVPITIFMNSFRIAVTGLLVESTGTAHIEGFLHFFEGWVVFMSALIMFAVLAQILLKIFHKNLTLLSALEVQGRGHSEALAAPDSRPENKRSWQPLILTITVLVTVSVATEFYFDQVDEQPLERKTLDEFPKSIGEWKSTSYSLPSIIEESSGASDYLIADYYDNQGNLINVYIGYFKNQREEGRIPHSPEVCIPSGGWKIHDKGVTTIKGWEKGDIIANRFTIKKGESENLTYYWFKQGSSTSIQKMLARLDLIRFALFERRSDGALIRLVSPINTAETQQDVDTRLQGFATEFVKLIPEYVPD